LGKTTEELPEFMETRSNNFFRGNLKKFQTKKLDEEGKLLWSSRTVSDMKKANPVGNIKKHDGDGSPCLKRVTGEGGLHVRVKRAGGGKKEEANETTGNQESKKKQRCPGTFVKVTKRERLIRTIATSMKTEKKDLVCVGKKGSVLNRDKGRGEKVVERGFNE